MDIRTTGRNMTHNAVKFQCRGSQLAEVFCTVFFVIAAICHCRYFFYLGQDAGKYQLIVIELKNIMSTCRTTIVAGYHKAARTYLRKSKHLRCIPGRDLQHCCCLMSIATDSNCEFRYEQNSKPSTLQKPRWECCTRWRGNTWKSASVSESWVSNCCSTR